MRHLKHDMTSPLTFMDDVIDSKNSHKGDKEIMEERERCMKSGIAPPPDMTYKERCSEIRKRNEVEIEKYKQGFDVDDFSAVSQGIPVALNGQDKDCKDMVDLYSYRSAKMSKLRIDVLSTDGYLNDMCPICESVKVTTFDHYLPKTQYQLFAVHPLNLIPCCTVCNGHKLKTIFDAKSQRKFWNAYLDIGTSEQYLFCDITEKNGMPKASFRVEKGNLSDRYYEIVKTTFDDLKLNDNYKESSDRVTVGLKNCCCNHYLKNQPLSLDTCLQAVGSTIYDKDVNNWELVLKKALIVTDIFKAFVAAALKQEYGITV